MSKASCTENDKKSIKPSVPIIRAATQRDPKRFLSVTGMSWIILLSDDLHRRDFSHDKYLQQDSQDDDGISCDDAGWAAIL